MTASSATGARFRVGWAVRLAVSVLILAIIFSVLPLSDVMATIRRIDFRDWLATLGVFLIGHVVAAVKWQLLANSGARFLSVLRAHFGGLIANLSLPGVASGDVVRAALLYRRVPDKARLALGSVADRLIDTFGLLLIATVGLLFAVQPMESSVKLLAWVGVLLAVVTACAVIGVKFHPLLLRRLPAGGRARRIGEQLGASIVEMSRQKGRLMLCLALSIAVQSAFIAATIGLARAADVDAPVAAWFFAWPLAKLIAMLPISIAGIGVREASLAGFLAPFGAPAAAVVGIGLLWQTVQLAGGLLGGLIVFLSDRALGDRSTPASVNSDVNETR